MFGQPRIRPLLLVAGVAFMFGGCGDAARRDPRTLALVVTPERASLMRDFVSTIARPIEVIEHATPATASSGADLTIALVPDLACLECYRVDATATGYVVHAGSDLLGPQFGVAALLEQLGFRFFHPYRNHEPPALLTPAAGFFGHPHEPEMFLRGLHLHTLHTIEAFHDFWQPSTEHLARAKRTIDWVVKNRGNYVQWVGLDDIEEGGAVAAAWRAHTLAINDYAASRGVRTGLGVQLFGASNLQQALDLLDKSDDPDPAARIRERYELAIAGLGFDVISLSFGEFFGEDPGKFIAMVDLAVSIAFQVAPEARVRATIHVGDSPDQRVTYMGESLLYYFLVKFADPRLVPWVHTTMYYNLFDPTSGAYHHEDFGEHREFLLSRIAAGKRVGYHPESAYWIAFDNSVPTYLPVYVRSRWFDLFEIQRELHAREVHDFRLQEHVLFSSGWEWGYWQHDWAMLRMSYALPERFETLFEDMFAPYGRPGRQLAEVVSALAREQHEVLIRKQLGAYLAARDALIDLGEQVGVVSQPDRLEPADLAALTPAARADFARDVVAPLAAHATRVAELSSAGAAIALPRSDPFVAEVLDGLAIDEARVRFVVAIQRAVLAHLDPDAGGSANTAASELRSAESALTAARVIVARRHTALHDPSPTRLLNRHANETIYQYGYLYEADLLCYWDRELHLARKLINSLPEAPPGCVLSF